MNVFLDSNVICADFMLESNAFQLLLNEAAEGRARIVLPEIVLDEVGRKYRDVARDALVAYRASIRELGRLNLASSRSGQVLSEGQAYSRYVARLKRRLQSVGTVFLAYPQVGHKAVTQRILSRARPSSAKDDAYRDTLIWLTLLDLVKSTSEDVAFITADMRAFGDESKRSLHPDLLRDLRDQGVVPKRVTLYPTLRDFTQTHVAPAQRHLIELKRLTFEDSDFSTELIEYLYSLLRYGVRPALHWGDTYYRDEALVGFEVHGLEFRDARQLGDDRVLVEVALLGEATIAAEVARDDVEAVSVRDSILEMDEWVTDDPLMVWLQFSRNAVADYEATWDPLDHVIRDARLIRVRVSGHTTAHPQHQTLF